MYLLLAFQKITYAENLKPTQLVEQIKIYLLPLKAGIENSYVSYFSIKISEPHLIWIPMANRELHVHTMVSFKTAS